ncbi:MAG: DNA topoisomerase 3 [Clostridia bacterium]|nr:DNA topoisomerase 3 [Clostridia bacterium]
MGKTLVLAEKPSVGKDIARVLGAKGRGDGLIEGDDYVISWAIGHLVTLCEPDELDPAWKKWRMDALPMLPDTLKTKVIPKTKSQFAVLKRLLNDPEIDRVICATDSGREGELIFRYIYDQAKCKKPVDRLWISSMTDAAIREGFRALRPDADYDGLYESARCRSEADWLVGMNASRAYTLRYDVLLSVGRVQTPTLALLVQRDREIRAFTPKDYWEIRAGFGDYEGLWVNPESKDTRCFDEEKAKNVAAAVKGKIGRVTENERELKRQPPPQLYDLTALQRDANRALGLSAAKTLEIAQALYEKHKLLTYPRTDSRYLPHDMKSRVAKVIATLPEPWASPAQPLRALDKLPAGGRVYNDAKVSDHHALVPTGSYGALDKLSDAERRVFDMVVRRLLAVHYPDYEYQAVRMTTRVGEHDFRTTGAIPLKEGWKAVYRGGDAKEKEDAPLPDLPVGTERTVRSVKTKACKTRPPEPHTDGTLLQAMENAGRALEDETLRESMKDSGLGTPATRAAIIERLIEVGYARRKGRAIVSTDKGDKLISVAPEELTSPIVTGRWEKSLAVMAHENDPQAMAQLSDRFMEGIRRFAAFLVEQAKTAAPDAAFEPEDRRGGKGRRKTAAVKDLDVACPLCHEGHVTENSKAFSCSRWREGCALTIWKNCLESRGGPTLTPALVKLMIEKREVAGSTGVITYEPGSLPAFAPNENAVIPVKEKKAARPARKTAAKPAAGGASRSRKKAESSADAAPKKRARRGKAVADKAETPEAERPIESLLDLLKD